jgi:hypothetical protein
MLLLLEVHTLLNERNEIVYAFSALGHVHFSPVELLGNLGTCLETFLNLSVFYPQDLQVG